MVRLLAVALRVLSVPSAAPGVAGIAVTTYPVIVLPFGSGAEKVIVACPLPAVATTFLGASGTGAAVGVTLLEGLDAGPVPIAFVAVTVNV